MTMLAAFIACFAVSATASIGRQVPIPPAPTQWVIDGAGFISAQASEALNRKLQAYERATGHQVIVWIGDSTGDAALEDWTIRAFEKWHVGRKELDDGVILFIFAADRKIRIEVGYGLESVLTDARASEIIRNDIAPRLRAGDKDGAVTAGVDSILAAIGGQGARGASTSTAPGAGPVAAVLLLLPFLIFTIAIIIVMTRLRRTVLYNIPGRGYQGVPWIGSIGSSSFGDGGGGGGGGFSGGGGAGGGGGASGGW
jgi:uncharacterized protein